jgi:nicotinamide mononucleotide transporter
VPLFSLPITVSNRFHLNYGQALTLSHLADQIVQQDVIEWIGLATGILYVILAADERPSCWIFGILSSAAIAWKSFTDYYLIADTFLQLFYVGMGIYGLLQWNKGNTVSGKKKIVTGSLLNHLPVILICVLLSWPLSWLLIHYADARYGYVDTLLTGLSVWATVLLIRKDLYNWVYWVVIDLVYIVLYWKTEGYLFALLFLIYAILSVYGFRKWKISKDEEYHRNIGLS